MMMRAHLGDHGKYGHPSVENDKRRRALPVPSLAGDLRFFTRIVQVRRAHDPIFITKAAAKNR